MKIGIKHYCRSILLRPVKKRVLHIRIKLVEKVNRTALQQGGTPGLEDNKRSYALLRVIGLRKRSGYPIADHIGIIEGSSS